MERSIGAEALLDESWTTPWLDDRVFPYWLEAVSIGDLPLFLQWLAVRDRRRAALVHSHAGEFKKVHHLVTVELSRMQTMTNRRHTPLLLPSQTTTVAESHGKKTTGSLDGVPKNSAGGHRGRGRGGGVKRPYVRSRSAESAASSRRQGPAAERAQIFSSDIVGVARGYANLSVSNGGRHSWPPPARSVGTGHKTRQHSRRKSAADSLVTAGSARQSPIPAAAWGSPTSTSVTAASADRQKKNSTDHLQPSRTRTPRSRVGVCHGEGKKRDGRDDGGSCNGVEPAVRNASLLQRRVGLEYPSPGAVGGMVLDIDTGFDRNNVGQQKAEKSAAGAAILKANNTNEKLGTKGHQDVTLSPDGNENISRLLRRRNGQTAPAGDFFDLDNDEDYTSPLQHSLGKFPSETSPKVSLVAANQPLPQSQLSASEDQDRRLPLSFTSGTEGGVNQGPSRDASHPSSERRPRVQHLFSVLRDIDEEKEMKAEEGGAAAGAGENSESKGWLCMRDPVSMREFRFDPKTREAEWEGGGAMEDAPGGMGLGLLSQEERERLKSKFARRQRRGRRGASSGGRAGGGVRGEGLREKVLRKSATCKGEGSGDNAGTHVETVAGVPRGAVDCRFFAGSLRRV